MLSPVLRPVFGEKILCFSRALVCWLTLGETLRHELALDLHGAQLTHTLQPTCTSIPSPALLRRNAAMPDEVGRQTVVTRSVDVSHLAPDPADTYAHLGT